MAAGSREAPAAIPDGVVRHRLGREDMIRALLVVAFGLVLYLFILLPMAKMIWRSLLDANGQWVGLANYARYFGTPAIAVSITNSLWVALVSTVLTVGLAFGYAYALTRTRMPARGLFRVSALA